MTPSEANPASFARTKLFGVLFALAFALRSIGVPTVFSKVGVQLPYAGDAYFHLRRIVFSVARFPESLDFDRYVSFPDGSQMIWPPAFDWTIAAAIRPFVDPSDTHSIEALASWAPVLLGAATTGMVGLFAARLFGRSAGWCAGVLYAVLPIAFVFSQLGMIDHHVAVALLSTSMLWLGCEAVARDEPARSWAVGLTRPSNRRYAAVGIVMAIMLLTWPGALIHVAVLQLAFGLHWLASKDGEIARSRAIGFATSQAMVALCVAPFGIGRIWREFGDWSPMVLSNFQPVYFASAALMVVVVQRASAPFAVTTRRGPRALFAFGLAALGAGAALALITPLREAVVSAGSWFTRDEILLSLASEMRPILAIGGVFDTRFALSRFGAGFLVLPLVWLVLVRRTLSDRDAARGLLLFWTLAFTIFTLRQWRFGNTLAVAYAILIGAVCTEWASGLRARMAERPTRPVVEIVAIALLVAWSTITIGRFYRPIVSMNLQALTDAERRSKGPLPPTRRIHDEAGRWLARNTPETSGYLDPSIAPEYGVLSDWGSGHILRYRSRRPMVQDPFGPYAGRLNFEAAWAYYAEPDEDEAIRILDRLGVRYVIGGRVGAGAGAERDPNAMANRLYQAYGASMPLGDGLWVPGLARHRLLFYAHAALPRTPSRPRAGSGRPESLGVWEVVRGARIEGRAAPGSTIRLSLDLTTGPTTRHVYRRQTVTNDDGSYRFVVPYPTDDAFSPDVRAARSYWIQGPDGRAPVSIPETAIQSGDAVAGPDLRGRAHTIEHASDPLPSTSSIGLGRKPRVPN